MSSIRICLFCLSILCFPSSGLTQTNETDDFTVSTAVPDDVSTENPDTITVSGIDDTTMQPSGIPYSMYTLKFEGNCTVLISGGNLQRKFRQKLTEMLTTILKVNESQINLGSVLCGSVLINVTISNIQNTDTTSLLKSRVDSGNFNFSFVADNNTYAYSAESIQVLVEPPKVTSGIVPSTTKSTKEPGSGTSMPVPGKNNDENIRMIIIIVCAVGGGLLVLVILICICYYCRRKCSKASGSFDLGDTPSPHIKSEDFKLEKMPRSPGYYNEDGYVVKNEYSDPYIENKRSPDSGTFSLGENGTQNDNNQNEKPSNYDNIDTEDVSGRRLSREALVREQRSESPGYDNPSFSEDEILNTPEPATFSVVVEDSTPDEHKTGNQTEEPATFSIISENQKSEPVTHSLETKTPQTEQEVVEEINPHTDLDIIPVVASEEVKAEPVSDSEPHVDTQHSDQTDNSKHSSLSSLSSASYEVAASEEPLPPPPAFIMVDYEENEDENDAMGSYNLPHGDQAESAELTLPVDHITVNVPQVNEVISDNPADKDSSESSHSDNESKHSSISNHQSMETSETPAHSHKDTIPTIRFPPPPDVGPETADQGSLTELDDHDAYDDEDALHHHDDDQKYPHDPYSSEEKSALDKDAESATLF